jgi:hypothetical protein
MRKLLLISMMVVAGCNQCYGDESSVGDEATKTPSISGVIYRNTRVYNVDYSFELVPDPNKIDRTKDLKLWIPIPQEWDSQKAVKIISVQPPPHAEYEDPEHGNRMLFWDFGKGPEKPSYKVDIKFRLESYEVHAEVDPNKIGPYDKTSKDYALYTRSEHTICITPKIKQMAQEAVGDEKNPYMQAKRIFKFVRKKVRYKMNRLERGVGTEVLLNFPIKDEKTGEEYYEGDCGQQSVLFIALCRAVLIPARSVMGFVGWSPWIKEEDLKLFGPRELEISPDGLAGTRHYVALSPHTWAEFYIPNYGWIPVDVTGGSFGYLWKERVIMSKGRDVKIGPNAPQKQSEGYGFQWVSINNSRADALLSGVWNIAKIRIAKVKILHSAPFPVVKYFVYFLTAIILAIIVGGLAGFICFHKFKKYALIGLSSVVPFVGLALPVIYVKTEEQKKCSKIRFVSLFWIFSIFLLWLLVFPVMFETNLVSWGTWNIFCITVVCILSVLVGWILVGFLCRKSWIKNKAIRIIIKTILFIIFWIVSACMLVVWIISSFA